MRGGKRQGAGRPKKNSRVLFKRVPAEHYEEIKEVVNQKIKTLTKNGNNNQIQILSGKQTR